MVRCFAFFVALFTGSVAAVTFEEVQRDVFEFSCAGGGCHGGGVFPTLLADRSYSAIVNVKSRQNRDLFLIEPFNPTDSYLLRKVENRGIFGDLMPQSGPIAQERQKLLRDWIAGGALEFGEPESSNLNNFSAQAFLQTTSSSNNVSFTHLINSSDNPLEFIGTLYDGAGNRLGSESQSLHTGTIAPQGRLILSSDELEVLFGIGPWSGPAVMEVRSSSDFRIMTRLTSPSGLISNTNCVTTTQVDNVVGFDSSDVTYVRFINTGDEAINSITGTLYDESGNIIGDADSVLVETLAPRSQVWRSRDRLSTAVGDTWNGTATLKINAPPAALKLLNLNYINDETFFNFSCYESATAESSSPESSNSNNFSAQAFLQTTSSSNNVSFTHLINSSDNPLEFIGTLYDGAGNRLGSESQSLHTGTIAPQGRLILSSDELEVLFGIGPWSGPAVMEVRSSSDFRIMTRLTSPSGLISNTNCVTTTQVDNVVGFDSSDVTYVRFINTGDEAINSITGTLYDESGNIIGDADSVLVETLAPRSQVWRSRDRLSTAVGDTWNGTATLKINAPPAALKLLNLNYINDETFFNFSCYESATSQAENSSALVPTPTPRYGY